MCVQLRGRCLQALSQLLAAICSDPPAAEAFKSASSSGSGGGRSLSEAVAQCLGQVAGQDPSAAHKALAAQAASSLQQITAAGRVE